MTDVHRKIDAYDAKTGAKLPHPIPEHWLAHPVLGKTFRKTPRQATSDEKKS